MKHTLKLLTLSLLAVIFLGCVKANPYLGKWHPIEDKNRFSLEILEGGNLIITGDEESGIGKWNTSEGSTSLFQKSNDITQKQSATSRVAAGYRVNLQL